MSYFDFPHTRNYDTDLGYIIKKLQEVETTVNEFSSINEITYHDPIKWDITTQYTRNTIVVDGYNTYLSIQPVPSGVDISNEDYWLKVADFTGYIEDYKHFITTTDLGNSDITLNKLTTNNLIEYNGKLYKVIRDIEADTKVIIGTNIEAIDVNKWVLDFINDLTNKINLSNVEIESNKALINANTDSIVKNETAINTLNSKVDSEVNDIHDMINDNQTLINNNTASITKITNSINIDDGTTFDNNIKPTVMPFNNAHIKEINGSSNNPIINTNPSNALISHHKPNGTSAFEHNVLGTFVSSIAYGSNDTSNPSKGVNIGFLGNAVNKVNNKGSISAPSYDYKGGVIGVAGFARADRIDTSVITGLWGYAQTPSITETEFNAISDSFGVFGIESNIQIDIPDIGHQLYNTKGSTCGLFINNYRDSNTGQQNYTFGISLGGTPINGDYTDTDISNWNCYHTGILLDKILDVGIEFGYYIKEEATLIKIQDGFSGTANNVTGLALGNSKINMGNYIGNKFNNNDLWANSGRLYMKYNNINHGISFVDDQLNANNKPIILGQENTGNYPNNSLWTYNNNLYFKDNSGVIHTVTIS